MPVAIRPAIAPRRHRPPPPYQERRRTPARSTVTRPRPEEAVRGGALERRRSGPACFDRGHETVAPAGQRLHEPRTVGGIVQGIPQPLDRAVEADVEVHERVAGPEGLADLLARHDLARPLEEEGEDLEGLLLQPDLRPVLVELTRGRVELEASESVRRAGLSGFHERAPRHCNSRRAGKRAATVTVSSTYGQVRRMSVRNQARHGPSPSIRAPCYAPRATGTEVQVRS